MCLFIIRDSFSVIFSYEVYVLILYTQISLTQEEQINCVSSAISFAIPEQNSVNHFFA